MQPLTDFYFQKPSHQALSAAVKNGSVQISPHPFDFALLTNESRMMDWTRKDLSQFLDDVSHQAIEKVLLKTQVVSEKKPRNFGQIEKIFFFKPFESFGGKERECFKAVVSQKIFGHTFANIPTSRKSCAPPTN